MTDTAEEIREYFERRKIESLESTRRTYSTYGRFEDVFEKAAEICDKLKANVADYVDSHFYNVHSDTVQPQFLAASNSIKKYNEYMAQFKTSYEEVFTMFLDKLKRQIKLGRAVEWILNCKDFDFPPWFRICITKDPIPEVIKNYRAAALQQYTGDLRDFLISKKLDYRRILNEV